MNPNIAKRRHVKSAAARENENRPSGNGRGLADHHKINVGERERQLSMIGGTVLAVCGLLRGSLSGLMLAGIGGAFIWRGHTGHCEMYHMLGHSTADNSEHGREEISPPAHEQFESHLQGYESHAAGDV
ncbi:MAG TPA: DUF2892 domain-containing protein [Pirellulaceae bacterium]|jgi:uncharacterized membrane protein